MSILGKIRNKIRYIYIYIKRHKLKNKDFTIISNDCLAGCIYHDLGLKFTSPTINYWMSSEDYIKYLEHLEDFLHPEIVDISNNADSFPKAKLVIKDNSVICYLLHYKSFEEFKEKYIERSSRVNLNKLFVINNDRNGCTMEHLYAFNNLKYKNKVCFTHIPYKDINSTYYIKGSEDDYFIKPLMNYTSKISIKKFYDKFKWIEWFNNN